MAQTDLVKAPVAISLRHAFYERSARLKKNAQFSDDTAPAWCFPIHHTPCVTRQVTPVHAKRIADAKHQRGHDLPVRC